MLTDVYVWLTHLDFLLNVRRRSREHDVRLPVVVSVRLKGCLGASRFDSSPSLRPTRVAFGTFSFALNIGHLTAIIANTPRRTPVSGLHCLTGPIRAKV